MNKELNGVGGKRTDGSVYCTRCLEELVPPTLLIKPQFVCYGCEVVHKEGTCKQYVRGTEELNGPLPTDPPSWEETYRKDMLHKPVIATPLLELYDTFKGLRDAANDVVRLLREALDKSPK